MVNIIHQNDQYVLQHNTWWVSYLTLCAQQWWKYSSSDTKLLIHTITSTNMNEEHMKYEYEEQNVHNKSKVKVLIKREIVSASFIMPIKSLLNYYCYTKV